MRRGNFVFYDNQVGVIANINHDPPAVEIHFLMPDGTTRMRLNEDNPNRPYPETDSVILSDEHWHEIELLSTQDTRIPENRRSN
jgi:hypothetical protein